MPQTEENPLLDFHNFLANSSLLDVIKGQTMGDPVQPAVEASPPLALDSPSGLEKTSNSLIIDLDARAMQTKSKPSLPLDPPTIIFNHHRMCR
jgi:hypothetical protein